MISGTTSSRPASAEPGSIAQSMRSLILIDIDKILLFDGRSIRQDDCVCQ
jgi:hypothetical protein